MYLEQERISASSEGRLVFDPHEGAFGIAIEAVAHAHRAIHVSLQGAGDFWLDPAAHRAVWRIDDWEAFCAAPSSRLRVSRAHLPADEPPRPQAELMWSLGYHACSGRLPAGIQPLSVVTMRYWPNFTRLPHTPDMHRLCALLVRRPTSLHLARKMLNLEERQVYRFFSAAHAAGAIALATRQTAVGADDLAPPEPHSESSLGTMLRHLWGRMSGR